MFDTSDWPLFCGFGSCIIGGILYVQRYSSPLVKALKNIEELEVNDSLYQKVNSAGGIIRYVALSGFVFANHKTIDGIHTTDPKGTMKVIERSYGSHDSFTCEVTPFSLIGTNSNTKVNVMNPSAARKMELTKVHEGYEDGTVETVTRMLLCYSKLTIIGEMTLLAGRLIISPPSNHSLKYIFTNQNIADVIRTAEKDAKFTSELFSLVCFVIAGGFFLYWLEKRYYLRHQQEMEVVNVNNDIDNAHICTVCMVDPSDTVFLPCGHVCICRRCSDMVNNCPICRGFIEQKRPVFLV